MNTDPYRSFSRRERQIMDVIHQLGEASVHDVVDRIPDAAGYNSIRLAIRGLEQKGVLTHTIHKRKYIYTPTKPGDEVSRSALKRILDVHFNRSVPQAFSTLLKSEELSEHELNELANMIAEAKKKKGS